MFSIELSVVAVVNRQCSLASRSENKNSGQQQNHGDSYNILGFDVFERVVIEQKSWGDLYVSTGFGFSGG